MTESSALLNICGLHVCYEDRSRAITRVGRKVQAVRGVDLTVAPGKCIGLVGESGCGKTTLARAVLGLVPIDAGQVLIDGHNVARANSTDLRKLRQRVQMVFQQSSGSMNPRMTVGSIVGDPLRFVPGCDRNDRARRVREVLGQVGFDDDLHSRFPHELSGGQLQRVAIARALVLHPDLLICDEPVSALDVTAQIEVLDHLKRIQQARGLTILLITHDLDIAVTMCDGLAVMYSGRVVERGPTRHVIGSPQHPYMFFLNRARAHFDRDPKQPTPCLGGEPPSPLDAPTGCAFHPRCPLATDVCRNETPALEAVSKAEGMHEAACHHTDRIVELSEFTTLSGN